MEITISNLHNELLRLHRQVDVLNRILLDEGRLTDWARKELAKARAEKEESYTSLDGL